MTYQRMKVQRIIGIFPTTHGFGYAIFEGPLRLIDWGVKHVSSREQADNLKKFEALLEWFEPDLVVLENPAGVASRKGKRITSLVRAMARRSARCGLPLESYSRARIRQTFAEVDAVNKHEIALVIAAQHEELAPLLPGKRKPWMTEDPRMGVFDAASLVLTHFHDRFQADKAA